MEPSSLPYSQILCLPTNADGKRTGLPAENLNAGNGFWHRFPACPGGSSSEGYLPERIAQLPADERQSVEIFFLTVFGKMPRGKIGAGLVRTGP
ncbi:hypothetical protein [Metarhizobium album]|uniref:hypothetical protein n=1 Tax=Metarhizobium album TaxID=2182425 RepID=UPI000FFF2066|nr:hypothetical protein [Rhizobium album]